MAEIFRNQFGLPFVEVDGQPRALGCLKPDPLFAALPDFSTVQPTLPQSQWKENSLHGLGLTVRNQGGVHGSCTGESTVSALTAAKKIQAPLDQFPQLSATYIYGQINGGRDQGARVADAMVAVRDKGTCYQSQVPDDLIYPSQFPADADATAQRFRAFEIYKVSSWAGLCTALTLGVPCVSGIAVGRNFVDGQLDSNGVAPLPDVIVGGHALAHLGLKNVNGLWVIETLNSWTIRWGLQGWCYLQQGAWNPGFGFPFDAFAIYSVVDDPEDVSDLPPDIITT